MIVMGELEGRVGLNGVKRTKNEGGIPHPGRPRATPNSAICQGGENKNNLSL